MIAHFTNRIVIVKESSKKEDNGKKETIISFFKESLRDEGMIKKWGMSAMLLMVMDYTYHFTNYLENINFY